MGIALSLDLNTRDWTVSTARGDGGRAEITLSDATDGSEITMAGDTAGLVDLLETALADLVDYRVGEATDTKLASLAEVTERALDFVEGRLADADLMPERLLTPDEMDVGGWVRLVPSPVWREILSVQKFGQGPARVVHVKDDEPCRCSAHDTFPYRTAAEMKAEAPVASDRWGNGLLDSFTGDAGPETAA